MTINRLTANKVCTGFTLIEMMVVIGLITLVSLWTVPGIKKAYEDFKTRQDLENLDMLIASTRAYELILNEYPHLTYYGRWAYEANWTLPRYFTSGTKDVGGTINSLGSWLKIKPHKGNSYVINQQLTANANTFYIGIYGAGGAYNTLLNDHYPNYKVTGDVLFLQEIYNTDQELQIHRNRYY